MTSHALVNLMLTLPTMDGWYDKLLVYAIPRGTVAYVCHTRLGTPPLTQAALEAAMVTQAGSSHPLDVSARKEMRRARR